MILDLPGYTLTTRTYEGSETVLYRGRRDADGVPVAVKVTRNEYPTGRDVARLGREFALLQDLDDLPGVVRAYALEKCGRGVALVMEDLGTTSLEHLLNAGSIGVEQVLRIALSISGTLDSIHRRDVIHKDIKPHNIMIDQATGAPRLVDFGIATRLSRETPAAMSPESLEGTLAYMSPEQTGRMNRAVDLRTDLYSLGVTLFELLTGALPFPATAPIELIHSHIARAPAPPSELTKEVPPVLSDIVMKLLAKTPEERYQSARGLQADLDRCLSQWAARLSDPETRSRDLRPWIDPFPLGSQDRTGELRIPQKLYGRGQDVEALWSAFERARSGAAELVLISGYSGVGKSALVNELHKPIARQNGALVRGKFDPSSREIPLAPVAHALRELVRQILTESAAGLEAWRGALGEAVGLNGRLLFDLIPELEAVLGPQPEVPALGPTEARNRFELLVQRFVRVFATAKHPLVLFLDDLQWADPASLRLIGLLLGTPGIGAPGRGERALRLEPHPDMKHLLLLGAYRDNEVDAAHPLLSMLDELRETGAPLTELTLRPLDLPAVTKLLAETLDKGEHEIRELSALVFDKTQGNPFFLSQFLGTIHEEGLLSYDAASGGFVWDLARIQGSMVTDNVINLMLSKLYRFAPDTQRALTLAACIGSEFDLRTLSIIHQKSLGAAAADLWGALREGLVLPIDGDYRLFDRSGGAAPGSHAEDLQISYRFLHDRVREAAYALIPEERKEEVHLSIGRLLWARSGEPPRDEDLLEIVRHLHLGARRITDEAERLSAARLDLRAGRKAKARVAYKSAADSFAAGIELLGPGGWERDRALCFSLHVEGAESAYLSGALDRAESLFDVLLPRASSSVERARIHHLRLILYMTRGKHAEAVRAGLAGLSCLGVLLPETQAERQAAFGSGPAEVAAALGGRRVEDLVHAPALDDPEKIVAFQIFSDLLRSSYFVDPHLYPPLVFQFVIMSLRYGHSDTSAFGYMAYGFMVTVLLGRLEDGQAFGKLALALNEKFQNASIAGRLPIIFGSYLYLFESIRAAFPFFLSSHQIALECGDFVALSGNCFYSSLVKITAGWPLDDLRDEVDRFLVLMRRIQDMTATLSLTVVKQTIAALEGRTRNRTSLSNEDFDEDRFVAKLDDKDHRSIIFYYHALKLNLHLLYGEHDAALAAADKAEGMSVSVRGLYPLTRHRFSACLLLLALPAAETPEEEGRRGAAIARHRDTIAGLAAHCPKNFQHQLLLIDAEAARRSGKHAEAMDLYDEAINLAKENEFPQDEALANELCAKMYVAIGRAKAARSYMGDAYLGYLHWGALAKAQDIAKEHGHLLSSLVTGRRRGASTSDGSTTTTTLLGKTIAGSLRDAALVVRAVQAIAGETMLPKVIECLSTIVLECASAERGALLLEREGRFFVEATFGVEPEKLQIGSIAALDTCVDLARSVVLFVARTREPVVLDDARESARFAADPYIAAGHVHSVLCLPLLHQGRLNGLLYLENKKAKAAFTSARVELLELFSSQAAISIENARMVADVRAANDKVRLVNDRLEAEVAERTEALRVSYEELGAANRRLELELTQRAQGERERMALQEQMIEAQRARLAEMSTPLIPITDRIMVMPLIGTVDPERAAQVLEVALDGAAQRRARVVILDITGIRHIDTQVMQALLQCATALRLLGAQAVLTGIRPDVAQTMVGLGIELGSTVTHGTLQSGIAYALRLSGERPGG